MAFLEISGLKKSFDGLGVLRGISFSVEKGDVIAVIGSSGSGKSTLLRCLIDLETVDGGSVSIDGEPFITDGVYPEAKRRRALAGKMGMVFQSFNLFPHMTVRQNLTEPYRMTTPGAADAEEIRRLGIRIRRLESTARIASASQSEFRAPLRDTLILRNPAAVPTDIPLSDRIGPPHNLPDPHDTAALHRTLFPPLYDTLRHFRWQDPWVRVEGIIRRDSVQCRICSVDTLRQVVHRIPHRFLFIRWGTKALRQEIVSTNPHTRIVHAEYIRLER